MKIYTKTGDEGTTSLFGGKKLPKSHMRIDAYGTIDELNGWMGLLRDQTDISEVQDQLLTIQHRLFDMGSSLASDPDKKPTPSRVIASDIEAIEQAIDKFNEELEPLRNFILPGGSPLVSQAHIARAVARRAERKVVALSMKSTVEPIIVQYLNRLSDYIFILCRLFAARQGVSEVKWTSRKQ
jgi:cob(I)alamin adenosyltransferase